MDAPAPLLTFDFPQKVLFRHCDPAGIVFYPRYFEMINDCVEAFFADILRWPFAEIHGQGAVPTASIAVDFTAPSRLGDTLLLTLALERVGGASMGLAVTAAAGEEVRFRARSTLVHVGPDGRPRPWPERLRARVAEAAA